MRINHTRGIAYYSKIIERYLKNEIRMDTLLICGDIANIRAIYFEENVWLTQKTMGLLYNVETHTINYHLKEIFAETVGGQWSAQYKVA